MSRAAVKSAGDGQPTKPQHEIGDIFRAHGPSYRRRHALPISHLKVMRAIEVCRTADLGGHVERCDRCGFERNAYNSCRNRHCPKCQSMAKAEWLERRQAELLPVEYFHLVFTLPHELNSLTLFNKKIMLDLLFKVVAETLEAFAGHPRHGLGGKLGFTAVLHTWDQRLLDHFHLHCVVPGGVLSLDGRRFLRAKKGYLFPVKALSQVFRGKYIDRLKRLYVNGQVTLPHGIASSRAAKCFFDLVDQLWRKDWVVYSKAPFQGPKKVLDYLGRYTHRVAISNHRIANVEDDRVTFRYRDRRDADKCKLTTISTQEFIRRFLLHVLPNSFRRIRHYGFLANRCKAQDLSRCRELLGVLSHPAEPIPESVQDRVLRLTGVDITQCPRCKEGHLVRMIELPTPSAGVSGEGLAIVPPFDTS